jgi:hypothetical protein
VWGSKTLAVSGVSATPPRVYVRVSEAEGLSRATVELGGDRVQCDLVELAQVGASGEVLAEQTVDVLVLPGAARVAEVHLDAGVDRELGCSAISRSSRPPARPATLAPGGGGP